MAAQSCGNGTNFDWLRKSCDISTCDLGSDGNPEKYGRPMKSAIACLMKIGILFIFGGNFSLLLNFEGPHLHVLHWKNPS